MATRIYSGALTHGSVDLGSRVAAFVKGESLEVSDEEAARLDRSGGWSKPKPAPKPKGDKPATPESPPGDQPEPQEP